MEIKQVKEWLSNFIAALERGYFNYSFAQTSCIKGFILAIIIKKTQRIIKSHFNELCSDLID